MDTRQARFPHADLADHTLTEFNDNWWAKEQLNGLQGANVADTTSFTDNGYFDYVNGDNTGVTAGQY